MNRVPCKPLNRIPFLSTVFLLIISCAVYAQEGASGKIGDVNVEITIDQSRDVIQKFNIDLARAGITCEDDRVISKPDDPVCCNQALRQAGTGIEKANFKKGAWDSIKGTLEVGKDVIQAMLLPELEAVGKALEAADFITRVLDSETFGDYIKNVGGYGAEKFGEFAMEHWGKGDALDAKLAEEFAKKIYGDGYDILKKELFGKDELMETTKLTGTTEWCPATVITLFKEGPNKTLQLNVAVYGDCNCTFPPLHPMRTFSVRGRVRLTPVPTFDKASNTLKIHYTAGKPEYMVEADCNCQKPEYGLAIPQTWTGGNRTALVTGIPGLITVDRPEWCSYMPPGDDPRDAPPGGDDPRDTPVAGPPDDPRDIDWPDDPRDTPGGDDPRDVPRAGDDPRDAPIPTGDDPRDKDKPDDPRDVPVPTGDDPRDKDEPDDPRDVPVPPILTVKATQQVLESGRTVATNIKGALVKFGSAAPPLPIAGNTKDEKTKHDAEPLQGVTGADGTVVLNTGAPAKGKAKSGRAPLMLNLDLTPQDSFIVALPKGTNPEDVMTDKPLRDTIWTSFQSDQATHAVVYCPKTQSAQVQNAIGQIPNVLYSELNYCRTKQEKPDPYFASKGSWRQNYDDQWAIKRVGFTEMAGSAWGLIKQPNPVIVAVIDTGLDWNHQDISWDQIWNNKGEIPENGKDDDKNGYIDDVIGWNFIGRNSLPWDDDGHGTFVAGVIAATKGNGVGIAGINPNAKIMVLKALNAFGHTRASFLAEAIIYAANKGAKIINISVGGKNLTKTEQIAINFAHSKGAIVVCAAGNEAVDIKDFGPSGANNVIAVAASDVADKPARYSNWGAGIDISAPGNDILSLRARATDLMRDIPDVKYNPGDAYVGQDKRYYRASGTSFAAPIVTGVASLLLTQFPNLTSDQVERMLLQSAKDIDVGGVDQFTGYGLVNATAALQADPNFFVTAEISGVNVVQRGGKQVLEVTGTAEADRFKRAWLEIGAGENPTQWKRVSQDRSQPVKDGVVSAIADTEFQGSPVWIIRLMVEHQQGKTRESRFELRLE